MISVVGSVHGLYTIENVQNFYAFIHLFIQFIHSKRKTSFWST